MGSVRLLPQKCRDVPVLGSIQRHLYVSVDIFVMWGCSILCARKSAGWCFYGPLGWHTLRTSMPLVCRPCRASSRDISHGTHISAVRLQAIPRMIWCHIARQARHFSKNFFTFFGVCFCDVFLWGRCRGGVCFG